MTLESMEVVGREDNHRPNGPTSAGLGWDIPIHLNKFVGPDRCIQDLDKSK